MIIIKGAKIKCKKCNTLYDISPEEFGLPVTTSDERSMGYETQYSWEFEFLCNKCSNDLKVTIEGFEYPEGFLNYQEFSSEGCVIIKDPSLEVNNNIDSYDEMD